RGIAIRWTRRGNSLPAEQRDPGARGGGDQIDPELVVEPRERPRPPGLLDEEHVDARPDARELGHLQAHYAICGDSPYVQARMLCVRLEASPVRVVRLRCGRSSRSPAAAGPSRGSPPRGSLPLRF